MIVNHIREFIINYPFQKDENKTKITIESNTLSVYRQLSSLSIDKRNGDHHDFEQHDSDDELIPVFVHFFKY